MLEGLTASKFLGGTAIAGLLVATWDKIKVYMSYAWGLLFVRINIQGSELRSAFMSLLRDEFHKMSFNQRYIEGEIEYVRPMKRNQLMAWLVPGTYPTIYRRGWRFLSFTPDKNNAYVVTFFRWEFKFEELIQEAIDKYNSRNSKKDWKKYSRFRIIKRSGSIGKRKYEGDQISETGRSPAKPEAMKAESSLDHMIISTPLFWKLDDIGQPQKESALNDLYYKDNVKEAIKEAFLWRDSEEWFKERGVPWKRGFLLSGPPGCVTAKTKIRIRKKSNKGKHKVHVE